jgi:hypothetical protein
MPKTEPKEAVLPTHRDDIFAFLKSFHAEKGEMSKLSGEPKDFSSPIGGVMSQQSTSAESHKIAEKQEQQHRQLIRPEEAVYLECYSRE